MRRVLGDVAQNFHQLLQSVQLGSQSALSRLAPDHQARRDLEQISSAVDAAHSTSRQLLAFAQKLPLRPVLLDLNELVSETDSALRGLIGDEIKLVTALGPALGRVKADPASLRQILIGLALNARDAMPEGGRLTIETGNFRLGDDARDVPPTGSSSRAAGASGFFPNRATVRRCGSSCRRLSRLRRRFDRPRSHRASRKRPYSW